MPKYLALALAALVLAGCNASPVIAPMPVANRAVTASNPYGDFVKLTVPAEVANYARDYVARMEQKYGRDKVVLIVSLHASKDGFKTSRSYDNVPLVGWETNKDGSIPVQLQNAIEGEYEYYLKVRGYVKTEHSGQTLPDFFVSNYGKNFRAYAPQQ